MSAAKAKQIAARVAGEEVILSGLSEIGPIGDLNTKQSVISNQ
jgi:hypothetical protein